MKKIAVMVLFALFGLGTSTAEAKPKAIGAKPKLIGAKPKLIGAKPKLIGAKPKLIGMPRATRIATSRVHGTVKSKELEKEHGKWIYSFDISTGKGKITEVNINAYTGKVISVEHENAAKEAKEAKDEKKGKN